MIKRILFAVLLAFTLFSFVVNSQTITVTQADTFAIKGLPDQPILKININTGAITSYSLERLVIRSLSDDSLDIKTVKIYRSLNNRFSKADYPGEETLITSGVKLLKDSAVFSGLTFPLNAGDNIIWVVYDLAQTSKPGDILDAYIKAGGIRISGSSFPAADENPSGEVLIRQKYFSDNFESFEAGTRRPLNWTVSGDINAKWEAQAGGYSDNPYGAKSGSLNARSYDQNLLGRSSWLISKPLNLSLSVKPKLTFYHAQMFRPITGMTDSVGVYYGYTTTGPWTFIKNYTLATPDGLWVKREVDLPDGMVNSKVYLAFKSTAQYGFGVCIDSTTIYESNVSARTVKSIVGTHPILNIVPQESYNNPILRFNIGVRGNTGTLNFTAVKVTSLNTSDNDVVTGGVKLYYTDDSVFVSPTLVASASLSGGVVTFSGFTRKLNGGDNYYWITYDIKAGATPEDLVDAKIVAGDITISDGLTYPSVDLSPSGNRTIKQTIFFDDFETDKGWTYSGDFERGQPLGKGGVSFGFKDPSKAYSQANIIGTDLGTGTNDGDYSTNSRSLAVSPLISAKYFKNTIFNYARWLNAENQDSAVIEYQYENQSNWNILWQSPSTIMEGSWSQIGASTKAMFDRKNFKIRFRLGKTNSLEQYSGWNVDYLFVTGDSIKYDASVTRYISPLSACGLTAGEQIKVRVKNSGPKTLSNIPLKISLDGGKTWATETVPGNLAVDDSLDFSFAPRNLSKPSIYNIIVKASYPGDNYSDNDSVVYDLTSVPTYKLPYSTGFEKDTTFWLVSGINTSWQQSSPSGVGFPTSYEGIKCWKTNLSSGYYYLNENSYLESPCFDLSDVEAPVLDMYYKYYTTAQKSGARIEYSLDGGSTWNYMPKDAYSFGWNWYNDLVTTFHDNKQGWTNMSNDGGGQLAWLNGKQTLPGDAASKNLVRLRFHFKADSTLTIPDPGFAVDEFKFLNAPYDAGVVSIDNLLSPACQYANPSKLQLTVKNFGLRKIRQNDSIIIGIKVNNAPVVKDTFKLAADLNVNATAQFTMTKPVNMVAAGDYVVKAFVIEKLPTYYNSNNDTTELNVTVYQNPVTTLPDTVYTARLDTLKVKSYYDSNYTYSWEYNLTEVSTTNEVDVSSTGPGKHYLTAQNSISGCTTKDSVFIKSLIPNIGVDSILSPVTHCGYKTPLHPVIRIRNFGTDTMRVNQTIPVRIKLNRNSELTENIILTSKFSPGDTYVATLTSTLNLLTAKDDTLKISTGLPYDVSSANDTTIKIFTIYGYPKVFLGNDTTVKGILSYTLDAGSGFKTYLWSDGSTNTQTYAATKPGTYMVTVTDNHDCPGSDTIKLHMVIHDLQMQKLVSPINSCTASASTPIKVQLKNFGTDTIQALDTVMVYYSVNGGAESKDTLRLASMMKPNDSIQYTFKKTYDISAVGAYKFNFKALIKNDIRATNDTLTQVVNVYGNPVVNLGTGGIKRGASYTLDAGEFMAYDWQDTATTRTWVITKDHFSPGGIYSVTVTDNHGCKGSGTVGISLFVEDYKLEVSPKKEAICVMSDPKIISVNIRNNGNFNVTVDKLIKITYTLNNEAPVTQDVVFKGAPNTYQTYVLTTLPVSQAGNYKYKLSIQAADDIDASNDTITYLYQVLGYPKVDLGPDTVVVDFPYTLHAGPGYAAYDWQDHSTDSTFTITNANYDSNNKIYTVIVTNSSGCSVVESIVVVKASKDLEISKLSIPDKNCTLPASSVVGVELVNWSTVRLNNESVTINYTLDGGTQVSQVFNVSMAPKAKATFNFTDPVNISAVGTHNFVLGLSYAADENASNNSLTYAVNVYGNPSHTFTGEVRDTIKTGFPYTLDAGSGFASYKWQDNSTSRTIQVPAPGWYTVTVTDGNTCSAKDSVYIDKGTSIGELASKAKVKIYPNPATEFINLEINLDDPMELKVDLIGTDGKVMFNRVLSKESSYLETIDVSHLNKGVYYLRIYEKNSMLTHKIIVR